MMPFLGKRRDESFRTKLLRILRISLIAGLALTGISVAVVEIYLANDRLKADLETMAKILGDRSVAALVFDDADAATNNLRAARFHSSVVAVCLYRYSGELFAHYSTSDVEHTCTRKVGVPVLPKVWLRSSILTLSLLSLIEDKGQPQGWIYLEADTKTIQRGLFTFVLLTVVVLAIVSTAATALTRRLLRHAMEPLDDLHDTATAVAQDPLSKQRAIKTSDDEIGELVDMFNHMLDSIASENLALVTSEARFRVLTSGAPIGIYQLNEELNLEYANEKWQTITGVYFFPDAVEHYKANILPDDLPRYQEFWQANLASDSSSLLEFRYRDSGKNHTRHLMEYVSPLLSADGRKEGYIGTLFDVTELKDAQLELEKLAFFDPLTDLPNRRFFHDHLDFKLAEARRTGSTLAVMMVDLDNFKRVNDTLGHAAGDELLQVISKTIRRSVREQDVVSRMGGDEFLVLLSSIEDSGSAAQLAHRIQTDLGEPHSVRNHKLEISASLGVAVYPGDGATTEELIKNSDIALYHAKELGRHRISFYSKELDQRIRENLRIESKLKSAIDDGVLEIFLQPQYSSDTMRVVWAEALVRWNDPTDGYISPARFIPIAEEAVLIHRIGNFVLEQVCDNLTEHGSHLSLLGIEGISINLSTPQLYSKNLAADIRHVLNEYDVAPDAIEFEITESTVMNDVGKAIVVMTQLRDIGCRISIDDFGTGYSSLSYLSRFPINSVKIDRSFIRRIPQHRNDVEIASAIIAMSHKLGLSVVAEGVETEEQKVFLVDQGCELLQGFLLATPENISHFVTRGRQRSLNLVDKE